MVVFGLFLYIFLGASLSALMCRSDVIPKHLNWEGVFTLTIIAWPVAIAIMPFIIMFDYGRDKRES